MKRILAILGAVLAITFLTAKIFADQNDLPTSQNRTQIDGSAGR